jgi:lipoprotein-anchoring transpeptidase ErfK/SrfK
MAALLSQFWVAPAGVAHPLDRFDKLIYINQLKQWGVAYERGKKVREFPIMTGDDEKTTNPGTYIIGQKVIDYYSRKYQTPMPYSLFFDMKQRKAIHEGEVPPPEEKKEYATHGCIHVEQPHMEWLYNWAEAGRTVVVVHGWRSED